MLDLETATAVPLTLSSVSDLARNSAPYHRAQRSSRSATERTPSHLLILRGPDPDWRRGKGCSEESCKRAEQDVICEQTGEPPPAHGPISPLRRQQVNFHPGRRSCQANRTRHSKALSQRRFRASFFWTRSRARGFTKLITQDRLNVSRRRSSKVFCRCGRHNFLLPRGEGAPPVASLLRRNSSAS